MTNKTDKKKNFFEEKLIPIAERLSRVKGLIAVRDGMALTLPLILIGSFLMIIASFPIKGWGDWLAEKGISGYLWKGVNSSFGLMGMVAAFGIAYSFAKQYKVNGVSAGIISLSAFIVATPFITDADGGAGIDINYLGSGGIFVAIVMGLLNGFIYQWFINKDIRIKMPESVPPAVSESFSAIIPGAVIIVGWLLIYAILDAFNLPNIHEIIRVVLGSPLSFLGATLPGTILVAFFNSLFWFLGVHGGDTVNQIVTPVWYANLEENALAHQAGKTLPHIITRAFIDNFVFIGGGGATLGLVLVIALIARKKKSSKLSKALAPITLVPGCFNINEPAMFGIPIVLNFSLLIPFILAPIANVIISYLAFAAKLVPLTYATASWTMPPIISGVLVTGSIRGSILQIILIIIDVLIYLPFYLSIENNEVKMELSEKKEDK